MFLLIVDEREPWLEYIWSEFVRIQGLQSEHRIIVWSAYPAAAAQWGRHFLIEYGDEQRIPGSLFIPRRKQFRTDDYTWLRDDLPVYRTTMADGSGRTYDVFYNAFVHLSRLEEWQSENSGKPIRSYALNHPRKNGNIWKIPVVNQLFNELEEWITSRYPDVRFSACPRPVIEYSHDVDYLRKTPQLRIKQGMFHLFNAGRRLSARNYQEAWDRFRKAVRFAATGREYWYFDYWMELEKADNIRSTYYLFAMQKDNRRFNVHRWLIDPSYDIGRETRLRDACRRLIDAGHIIGLHGSYYSAEDEPLLMREKERLEQFIDGPIKRTRQHWLSYYETKTPYYHERAGFDLDSSLGFNDVSGYRAGIASAYHPYDHRNQRPFAFFEVPLVIMDSHVYDYAFQSDFNDFSWFFSNIGKVKSFRVSIDWHQRVVSDDYAWGDGYKYIVDVFHSKNENMSSVTTP